MWNSCEILATNEMLNLTVTRNAHTWPLSMRAFSCRRSTDQLGGRKSCMAAASSGTNGTSSTNQNSPQPPDPAAISPPSPTAYRLPVQEATGMDQPSDRAKRCSALDNNGSTQLSEMASGLVRCCDLSCIHKNDMQNHHKNS